MEFTVSEAATGISASDPESVAESFADLAKATQESFWALALNAKNIEIGRRCLFVGGLNRSIVDLRVTYRYLIESGATRWVAVHNHPSGDVEPSEDDRKINGRLRHAGKMLELELLDSIIIGNRGRFWSAADRGEL
jgi:DNA repair protein RadC